MAENLLVVDGSRGEGGGQILRTVLSLSALTGTPVRIERIRAGRAKPGLAAQHLTAVRAAAAICRARSVGDELGSRVLEFRPGAPPQPGAYTFDVAAAREGGSAGSAPLVLQTIVLPLGLAPASSTARIEGGTHLPQAPFFDYVDRVWRPALAAMGIDARFGLLRSGWYPAGEGCIEAWMKGRGAKGEHRPLRPFTCIHRGPLQRVSGTALTANLASHIADRLAERTVTLLAEHEISAEVVKARLSAASPGAALFLVAEYENVRAGFSALGRRGRPAEDMAEEAVAAFFAYSATDAALDAHLGDQMLLPAAVAEGTSVFTVENPTRHLATNAWVIERFGFARIDIRRRPGKPTLVSVEGAGLRPWA